MTVLCEQEGHQLRMHLVYGPEFPFEEIAYEFSVDGGVVPWEMNVFQTTEAALQLLCEPFDLGGFPSAIQSFQYYKHIYKYTQKFNIFALWKYR